MITGALRAEIAGVDGEPARATMLSALLDGRALTATELAYAARITAQTASTHLARLAETGLITVNKDGQYRYFRLASPKVAQMHATRSVLKSPGVLNATPEEKRLC